MRPGTVLVNWVEFFGQVCKVKEEKTPWGVERNMGKIVKLIVYQEGNELEVTVAAQRERSGWKAKVNCLQGRRRMHLWGRVEIIGKPKW